MVELHGSASSGSQDTPRLRVALAIPDGMPFLERMLVGIARHAHDAGWTFVRVPSHLDRFPLEWLHDWPGDGVITAVATPSNVAIVRHLGMPVVNLVTASTDDAIPLVSIDHRETGRVAARHLRSRALTSLAFYGTKGHYYSDERLAGFGEVLAEAGIAPAVLELDMGSADSWIGHQRRLESWLLSLPPRTGVFACRDSQAVEILETSQRLGLRVPEHLAVLGVDDDPVLCEFAQPRLSSIRRDDEGAGYAAATMLQRLMEARRRGQPAAGPLRVMLPPLGIAERTSTAIYHCQHPVVAEVVQRILSGLERPLAIDDLTRGLPLARRRIESLFRAEMGEPIYRFILRRRVARARELMAEDGRRTMTAVARACGFTSLRGLRLALQRVPMD